MYSFIPFREPIWCPLFVLFCMCMLECFLFCNICEEERICMCSRQLWWQHTKIIYVEFFMLLLSLARLEGNRLLLFPPFNTHNNKCYHSSAPLQLPPEVVKPFFRALCISLMCDGGEGGRMKEHVSWFLFTIFFRFFCYVKQKIIEREVEEGGWERGLTISQW